MKRRLRIEATVIAVVTLGGVTILLLWGRLIFVVLFCIVMALAIGIQIEEMLDARRRRRWEQQYRQRVQTPLPFHVRLLDEPYDWERDHSA